MRKVIDILVDILKYYKVNSWFFYIKQIKLKLFMLVKATTLINCSWEVPSVKDIIERSNLGNNDSVPKLI